MFQAIILGNLNENYGGKLEKIGKNLILGPILVHSADIKAPKFFRKFYLYNLLNIIPGYHPRQFKGKLATQTRENVKNLILGPILAQLTKILVC